MKASIALLALILAGSPALCDEQYRTSISAVSGSPIQFTSCEVWARDWNKTILTAHVSSSNALVDVGVRFTNTSTRTIDAVQFAFVAYDAFNTILSVADLSTKQDVSADKVIMSPGAVVDLLGPRGWTGRNAHPERDHIVCSVEKVAFDDGSVWTSPAPAPTALPAASPAPKTKTFSDGAVAVAQPECGAGDVCAIITLPDGGSLRVLNEGAGMCQPYKIKVDKIVGGVVASSYELETNPSKTDDSEWGPTCNTPPDSTFVLDNGAIHMHVGPSPDGGLIVSFFK